MFLKSKCICPNVKLALSHNKKILINFCKEQNFCFVIARSSSLYVYVSLYSSLCVIYKDIIAIFILLLPQAHTINTLFLLGCHSECLWLITILQFISVLSKYGKATEIKVQYNKEYSTLHY